MLHSYTGCRLDCHTWRHLGPHAVLPCHNAGSLCRADISSKAGLPNTLPYLPIDEQFNETKTNGFLGDELRAALSLLPSLLPSVIHHDKHQFESFHDVDAMFTEVEGEDHSPQPNRLQ